MGAFDGGLGYSYPLQIVPDRAGLTPQLNLSYNSRRMDGVLSWVQSDWTELGRTVDTGYNGWQTAVIDEKDHQTIREADAFGRLAKVKEYTGTYSSPNWGATPYATTTYSYNVLDRLTQVQDAAGNTTSISYDPLGRKTSMTDPDMGAWSYAYDAAGNLTSQTDARDCTTSFTYDALNRLTGKSYSGTACATTAAVTYTYDQGTYGIGRRTRMDDGSGYTTWSYDARGRLTQETRSIDGVAYTVSYDYRADDQRYKVVYPDGEDVRTQYDAAGRPYRLWNTGWPTDIFVDDTTYNAQGQFKTLKYTNGLTTRFGYYGYNGWGIGDGDDAPNQSWANVHVGRLWKLCTVPSSESCPQSGNSNAVHDLRYAYDGVGNISSLRDKLNSNQVQWFSYDEQNRLTQAYTDSVGQAQYNRNYGYNAIGNLTSKAGRSQWYGGQSSGCPDGYLFKPHAVVTAGSDTFCYDKNGNQVKRSLSSGTYTLTYDVEGRLVGVSGAASATFTYDGDGKLVKRVAGQQTTVYAGELYEKNTSTGQVTKYYEMGGRRVAVRQAGTLYWLLVDHLGSSMVLVDGNGNKWKEQWYYPFGEKRYPSTGDISIGRRFTGQRWDDTIGLYDYRARYYDPVLGRFVQPDTVVPDPNNPQDLNRYGYGRNNPLGYTDPTGHDPIPPITFKPIVRFFEDYGLLNPMAPYYLVPTALGVAEMERASRTGEQSSEALVLTAHWYYELGEESRVYHADSEITRALIRDEGVAQARQAYIDNGRQDLVGEGGRYKYEFGLRDAAREFRDVITRGDWSTSFLGGYEVEIRNISETEEYNLVEITVINRTGWESATRVWGVSFKDDEPRSEWGPGGNLDQTYTWMEKIAK